MAVEYVTFTPGIIVEKGNLNNQVKNLVQEADFKPLPQGDHELDPVPGGAMKHLVTVFENGTGTYQTASPDKRGFGRPISLANECTVVLLGDAADRRAGDAIHQLLIHRNKSTKKS